MSARAREVAARRARLLAAPRRDAPTLELDAPDRATLALALVGAGPARLTLRLRADALPLRAGALDALVAVGVLGSAEGAFREAWRAVREEGRFVYGEPDASGTFAGEHLKLRALGFVPAPMDTVPELSDVPWRILVAFKPAADSRKLAERGHETH